MHVIGITGIMYAGKTTVGKMLSLKVYGHESHIFPFGASLKRRAYELGWDGVKDEKGRRLLQLLGTEICRQCIDPNYWVVAWQNDNLHYIRDRKLDWVFIDDVRFLNEAKMVKDMGGHMIRIIPRGDYKADTTGIIGHPSEEEQQNIEVDFTINNLIQPGFPVPAQQHLANQVATIFHKIRRSYE
jgi:hypothetical protein